MPWGCLLSSSPHAYCLLGLLHLQGNQDTTPPSQGILMRSQASGEVLLSQGDGSGSLPAWQQTCGTYVGCMFVDYMNLLRNGYGFASTGPVMTGALPLHAPLLDWPWHSWHLEHFTLCLVNAVQPSPSLCECHWWMLCLQPCMDIGCWHRLNLLEALQHH